METPVKCPACISLAAECERLREELAKLYDAYHSHTLATIIQPPQGELAKAADYLGKKCEQYQTELSAFRESAKLAEAVAEAVYQYSISGTDWRHKLADISDSVAAWRAHRAKSLEGGEGK